jgi:multidrug efflux pump subunit AcrA (membrane-fusion protein)
MYVQVRFWLALPEPPFLIPASALIVRAGTQQVAVVRRDGTVHYQKVDVGRDLGSSVEILSGLDETERLVVNVPDSLREGAPVRSQGS